MKLGPFVLALLVGVGQAHADDAHARARAAFKSGSQHYNLGEFQQALESFRDAYRNYDDPSFLFNIGQCERQLGHKREAVREYRAYLNNAPETITNRDAIKQIVTQLEKEIADEATAKMPPPPPPLRVAEPQSSRATLTASAPPPHEHTPAYKKWWVWTLVGGVAAAGVATGLGLGLTRSGPPTATTSLGTKSPF